MATRSTVGKLNTDGTVTSIYVHWDGYPEGVGATLREHYTTSEKIAQLLDLGDLSVLGEEIGVKKAFDTATLHNECLAYGRDRGEDDVASITHPNVARWLNSRANSGCEYGYMWDGTGWETVELNSWNLGDYNA